MRKIDQDWQEYIPELAVFSPGKLYRILGPLVVGVELIKLPRVEAYRPHFVVYPLWGNRMGDDLKSCLAGPLALMEFYNKKGLQFSIPYAKHEDLFSEVVSAVKEQIPVPLVKSVSLANVLDFVKKYSKTLPLSASPNSYLQAIIQEAKIKLALYVNNIECVHSLLVEAKERNWDMNHFNLAGVDVERWVDTLSSIVDNRNEFLSVIGRNKEESRMQSLPQSELVNA